MAIARPKRASVLLLLLLVASLATGSIAPSSADAGAAATISGQVRSSTGQGIDGALVAALRPGDFVLEATAVAGADGAYQLPELSPGEHLVYALDPAGGHQPGFFGGPDVVVVGAGPAEADPVLQASRGAITGTVRSDDEGEPLGGAWVLALGVQDGRPVAGTIAAGDGSFRLDELAATEHLLVALDPTGAHEPEYHDDTGIEAATPISVPAGAEVAVSPSLRPRPQPSTSSTLRGTVVEAGSGAAIAGAWALALDAETYQVEAGAAADAAGEWSLEVPAGGHLVALLDPSGAHAAEWHPDLENHQLAQAVAVEVAVGEQATVDADLDPTTGSIEGTVVEDGSGDPVAGAWALAISASGVLAEVADADGRYRIDDVPEGEVRATFVGPDGVHAQEYWDGGSSYAAAQPISLPGGATASAHASLAPRACGDPVPVPTVRCAVAAPTPLPGPAWATYTVAQGSHSATVQVGAEAPQPLAWFSSAPGRTYHFAFDASARYVLTNPTQPEDQLDWNKLPGLSDCGDLDLSENGWMFGWRWRPDLEPQVLEITGYANNDGTHLWLDEPLLSLTAEEVDAQHPLWFDMQVTPDGQRYEMTVRGPGSRVSTGTLPRACPATSTTTLKWASGLYFGGTSTAPHAITGLVHEPT